MDRAACEDQPGPEELETRRGQRPSAEPLVLTLRQIEVQTAQGKSIAVACKEAGICEQSCATSAYVKRSSTRSKKRRL